MAGGEYDDELVKPPLFVVGVDGASIMVVSSKSSKLMELTENSSSSRKLFLRGANNSALGVTDRLDNSSAMACMMMAVVVVGGGW